MATQLGFLLWNRWRTGCAGELEWTARKALDMGTYILLKIISLQLQGKQQEVHQRLEVCLQAEVQRNKKEL